MRKLIYTLSVAGTFLILISLQFSVSSCVKEKLIRDTIIVKDTIVRVDTVHPEWTEIGKHINEGLWASYPINGSVYDSTGNGHVLELLGGASLAHDMWGNSNSSINLDGIAAYGMIPDGKTFTSPSFSVSMFVLPRKLSGLIFGKHDYLSGKGATFNVGFDNIYDGERLRFAVTANQADICNQEASGSYKCQKTDLLNKYAWYHVVITYSGTTMKLYINGVLVDTQTNGAGTINFCPSVAFVLGSWWNGGKNPFDGKIDKIRIYTRELKANEVDYLYKKN